MLQAKLKVVGGRHHGKIIPLATRKFLIGREQDCHLRPNSELVSRHHCALWVDDFAVRVRDLGSTNGTFVNNSRVRGEQVLGAGDHIRVGKLDFELLVGDLDAKQGDSSQALPVDAATSETTPLVASDTSFEIPVPPPPEDTGSSILAPESLTPVPTAPAAGHNGDTTMVWSPQSQPGYGAEMYPPMGMHYQPPYQPAYNPYLPPGMGYQAYPQMPMGYPGMYPQMGGYGAAPSYAPPQQQQPPAAEPELAPSEEPVSMPNVRLPDPKTTGAKAPAPPPAPAPAPEPEKAPESPADPNNPAPFAGEQKPAANPNAKPSDNAADILKKYTQRRPV
ncbi:MAG TPA: FHA domain-containing protein [Planctomycetaceae bacterium]|jgi:pSer/pThr/pTyr-binding forkhead associated (FHA) protein|nr:FHA domain-containing protein [Planctomycetaceae bacterium]